MFRFNLLLLDVSFEKGIFSYIYLNIIIGMSFCVISILLRTFWHSFCNICSKKKERKILDYYRLKFFFQYFSGRNICGDQTVKALSITWPMVLYDEQRLVLILHGIIWLNLS